MDSYTATFPCKQGFRYGVVVFHCGMDEEGSEVLSGWVSSISSSLNPPLKQVSFLWILWFIALHAFAQAVALRRICW